MIYKILIKSSTNMQYAKQKVEIMKKEIVDDQIVEVPTGKYTTEDFSSTDIEVVKAKFLELLDTYRKEQLDVVADMKELVTINVEIINPSEGNEETNDGTATETPTTPTNPDDSGNIDNSTDDHVDEP